MLDITKKLDYRMECRFIKDEHERMMYLDRVPVLYSVFYELYGIFDYDYN